MKKSISILMVLAILVSVLTACGGGQTSGSSQSGGPAATGTPSGGKDTFTVSIPAEVMTLHPLKVTDSWGAMVIANVHDPLVRLDEHGTIQPALAERWEVSPDGLAYTFYLRQGVTFHDGTPFTSADVKYTLERSMVEPTGMRFTNGMDHVEILDDYTCVLHMKIPLAATLNFLAQSNNDIVSETVINKIGDEEYKTNPCGTGPFIFDQWIPGDRIILKANENYYLGAPAIKTLTIRNIGDKSAALVALETGDIDACVEPSSGDKGTVEGNSDLAWYETPSAVFYSLEVNNRLAPFDNVLVRKALDMATDRDEIVALALDGQGTPAHMGISQYGAGWTDEVKNAPYDPEQAKQLLTEAGFPDGFTTNIYVRDDFMKKAGQVIQNQWAKVGVDVTVHVMERGALISDMSAAKLELPMSMATDLAFDAVIPLDTLYSTLTGDKGGANFSFWGDPEYDRLADLARGESDPVKRADYVKQALLIEKEQVPRIPLFFPIVSIAMNKDVKGLTQPYPTNLYYWYNIHW